MKKNIIRIGFIGVCLLMCLSLSVGMLGAGPSKAGANEKLSDAPALRTEDGSLNTNYLFQLSDFLRDRFFLRQELISIDHWLDANIFKTSGNSSVVLGTDGWLYYARTVADYTGICPMSERELFAAGQNLAIMARYCEENGRQFLFVIAPHKNSVYSEHMPNFGTVAEVTNAERLSALLQEQNVPTADLFTALRQEEDLLYFTHDSHWNSKGAALGADLINKAFGLDSSYYAGDFSQTEPHVGDLYKMLYPAFSDPGENPVYGGTLDFRFTSSATHAQAILLLTESDKAGTLLAYRDSFGMLLFPYLADSYGSCTFSRSNNYDLTKESDYVLIELVERHLEYLIQYLPVMPALQADITLPDTVSGTISVTQSQIDELFQVTGSLPKVDDCSPIYIVSDGAVYEAFCLGETGFGIYLPGQAQYALCRADGEYVMYEIQ